MRVNLLFFSFLLLQNINAQADTTKWLRGFPVTDYMIDLNDSTKVVQLEMPEGQTIHEKQFGLIRGTYQTSHADTVQKGYGRCYLIKGNYYYFAISGNKSDQPIKEGDLLFTFMDKTDIYYGRIPQLASFFIQFQDVYEQRFFDRYLVFLKWSEEEESRLMDSMAADIRFTGNYFLENDRSMDKVIQAGSYKGKNILSVMSACTKKDLQDFIDYILARPRLYAGKQWKVSEIFATWLDAGAPVPKL
ncbi:MAG: hypothetical protein KDB99_07505 [Chitinophagaceae bacterium]|nr:hypothetical protein [Chitinophagaceae bacterium]MCB9055711.1 hypothetical protein [Chitinophagales bacterium]